MEVVLSGFLLEKSPLRTYDQRLRGRVEWKSSLEALQYLKIRAELVQLVESTSLAEERLFFWFYVLVFVAKFGIR